MATQTRNFIVFKDEVVDEPTLVVDRLSHAIGPTATCAANPSGSPPLVFAPDKENIDPSTGSRALSEQSLGKKRKTALAIKAQPASSSKKLRPLAEKPTKKPSSSSKSRATEKKTKRSSSSKRMSSGRTRREPSLPRLVEEGDEPEPLDQVAIDAKCKELTVLPLADISEAYEQTTMKEDAVEGAEKSTEKAAVAVSADEKVDRAATPPLSEQEVPASSSVAPTSTHSVFSTPERKRIYSAFTFSSPSPASQRYASARGSSVERFSDIVF